MSREVNWDFKFDPEEPRHSDGSVIPCECNCEECHAEHDVRALSLDVDFKCCTEEFNDRLAAGEICSVKPREHYDIYMVTDGKKCLECEHEKICDKPDHSACA